MKSPITTYGEALVLAKVATIVSWYRGNGGTLSLTLDDLPADRRTCIEIAVGRGKCGTVEIKTLCGFDAAKHRWAEYCSPQGSVALPDRRGLKALIDWIREQATKQTGCPNPEHFTIYAEVAA